MSRAIVLLLMLSACEADVFTRSNSDGAVPFESSSADGTIPPEEDATRVEASSDSPLSEAAIDSGPTCGTDGGACSAGSCCAGLHCITGACASCKPKGYIAKTAQECCDPQSFSGDACGPVEMKCGIPNYSGCNGNGVVCCPGSTCKNQGQFWQCSCGVVDTPCTGDSQCCSTKCGLGGFCS